MQGQGVGAGGHRLSPLLDATAVAHLEGEARPVHTTVDVGHRTAEVPPSPHTGDDDAVRLDVRVEDVVVRRPDPPLPGRGVELPLAHRVELWPRAGLGDRHPLVVADAVPGEVGPAVAGVDHRVLLGALDRHEEPGLGHVAVVHLGAGKDVLAAVRALNVAAGRLVDVVDRGVPAVQVRRRVVVLAVELEHGVALATGAACGSPRLARSAASRTPGTWPRSRASVLRGWRRSGSPCRCRR